jgi:hypothetical protein
MSSTGLKEKSVDSQGSTDTNSKNPLGTHANGIVSEPHSIRPQMLKRNRPQDVVQKHELALGVVYKLRRDT